MAKRINELLDAVVEPIKEASDVLSQMAEGKLGARVEGDYQGDFAVIKDSLNTMGSEVKAYVDEVSEVLNKMADKDLTMEIPND